jgi:hypothetical protein
MTHATQTPTADRVKVAAIVSIAVCETIREAGSIPSGTLYAALMTKGCTMQVFDDIIAMLGRTGLVTKRGDLLVWTGPAVRA